MKIVRVITFFILSSCASISCAQIVEQNTLSNLLRQDVSSMQHDAYRAWYQQVETLIAQLAATKPKEARKFKQQLAQHTALIKKEALKQFNNLLSQALQEKTDAQTIKAFVNKWRDVGLANDMTELGQRSIVKLQLALLDNNDVQAKYAILTQGLADLIPPAALVTLKNKAATKIRKIAPPPLPEVVAKPSTPKQPTPVNDAPQNQAATKIRKIVPPSAPESPKDEPGAPQRPATIDDAPRAHAVPLIKLRTALENFNTINAQKPASDSEKVKSLLNMLQQKDVQQLIEQHQESVPQEIIDLYADGFMPPLINNLLAITKDTFAGKTAGAYDDVIHTIERALTIAEQFNAIAQEQLINPLPLIKKLNELKAAQAQQAQENRQSSQQISFEQMEDAIKTITTLLHESLSDTDIASIEKPFAIEEDLQSFATKAAAYQTKYKAAILALDPALVAAFKKEFNETLIPLLKNTNLNNLTAAALAQSKDELTIGLDSIIAGYVSVIAAIQKLAPVFHDTPFVISKQDLTVLNAMERQLQAKAQP